MPRIPRSDQIAETATYHIYNRGNNKMEIFHDDHDFIHFLRIIHRYKLKFSLSIFHWVLMNNHFHLILELETPSQLSKCMGGIIQTYAQYHHKKWKSAGRIWQGRFVSQPVQKEEYLLECGRYIERNPMRAGISDTPWQYRWSSCNYYVNGEKDSIVATDPYYESFGRTTEERIANYKKWLMEGELQEFDNLTHPVGNKEFVRKLSLVNGRMISKKRRGRPKIKKK